MSLSQKLRIIWIEGRAREVGFINRSDICEAWDLSLPQATKDLVLFSELFPGRLKYDVRSKRYVYQNPRRRFVPDERAASTIQELAGFLRDINRD